MIMRIPFYFAFLALISFSEASLSNSERPNIIIFFSDDSGYTDFGFQGSSTHLTPALDKLAKRGVQFTRAYSSSSVCSPARAGLLTGRYQNRFGVEFNVLSNVDTKLSRGVPGLPDSEITIADVAKNQGYKTALIGKWHLGESAEFLPDKRGFDEYFGLLGGSSPYHPSKARRIISNYKEVDFKKLPYLTDAFGNEAVDFIKRNNQSPFLLYFPFNAPHGPMQAKPEYLEMYSQLITNKRQAANAALTHSMDENIGKVLDAVEELGLTDNTLVIFTNDNGGEDSQNGANNGALNGGKGTVLEGGIKVPMIISWPERFIAAQSSDRLVSLMDIFPTIASAIGADLAEDRQYDGVDLSPLMMDESAFWARDTLYWRVNWASAVRQNNWKLIRTPLNKYFLFDLETDPSEIVNLYQSNSAIAQPLKDRLASWEDQLPEPLWYPKSFWKQQVNAKYQILESSD
jgi:arylsulfatase A-like enzyme